MAKKQSEEKLNLEDTLKALEKKYSRNDTDGFTLSTGSIQLNYALGGGISSKRITELIAWEGAGKTTICLHIVADAQKKFPDKKALYIDAEHALSEDYARAIGVDWDNLIIFQPMSGEEGFDYAKELMKTGQISCAIFDSTSGLLPRKQMEDSAGSMNLGLHARLLGQEIPKTVMLASENNVAVVYVSQFREKIGVMFGSPETTQGGNSLKFWASTRIELRKSLEKDGDDVVGLNSKFKTLKCKTSKPFQVGVVPIKFGIGVDKIKEIIDLSKEYELIKVWGQKTTYNEAEYKTSEFPELLRDNEELFNELRDKVIKELSPKIEINEG